MRHESFSMKTKRCLDLAVSCISLVVLAPVLVIIALAVKLDSKGPVLFRQERIGQGGRPFRIFKFRTMVNDAERQGLGVTVAKSDWRITRVGGVLRSLGLDELPQLLNVAKGEMSIVGPRPTLGYQVEQYDDFQRRRLEMKPGITSLAVVRGRNGLSWAERIRLDVHYIEHWSLRLDAKIVALTLWKVLITREGIYGEGGVNDAFLRDATNPPQK